MACFCRVSYHIWWGKDNNPDWEDERKDLAPFENVIQDIQVVEADAKDIGDRRYILPSGAVDVQSSLRSDLSIIQEKCHFYGWDVSFKARASFVLCSGDLTLSTNISSRWNGVGRCKRVYSCTRLRWRAYTKQTRLFPYLGSRCSPQRVAHRCLGAKRVQFDDVAETGRCWSGHALICGPGSYSSVIAVGRRGTRAPKSQTHYSGFANTCKRSFDSCRYGEGESSFGYVSWLRDVLVVHFCTGFWVYSRLWIPLWRWHPNGGYQSAVQQSVHSVLLSLDRSLEDHGRDEPPPDPQWWSSLLRTASS